ncbi:MAG TPA: hypothetical protein VGJ81_03210 [Thermoanaerobaculia bacterium]|jgi:hypothetical protein
MKPFRKWFGLGVAIGAAVTAFVAVAWPWLYAKHPWPGSGRAAAAGLLPRIYTSSPVAFVHVIVLYVIAGLIVGFLVSDAREPVYSWLGVSASVLLLDMLWPVVRQSNLAPLAVIVIPIEASPFLLFAVATYALRWTIRRRHSRD